MQATFTLNTTTFAAPVSAGESVIALSSLTNIQAVGITNLFLFANREVMEVMGFVGSSGTQVTVLRGRMGTASRAHGTGETIYIAQGYQLFDSDPQGLAPANALSNPHINVLNGKVWVIQGDDEGPGTQARSWQEVTTTQTPGALGVRVTTTTTPS